MGTKDAENHKNGRNDDAEKDAVARRPRDPLFVLLPQLARKHGADADTGADAKGDDQHLDGEGEGQGVDGELSSVDHTAAVGHSRDEHAVDDVVHRLQYHRQNNRKSHRQH